MNNNNPVKDYTIEVYETSSEGHSLKRITEFSVHENPVPVLLDPEETFQTITGFGGSFTQSSAHLLNKLSSANRNKILEAYFSETGANYTLTRTHINSCDFSLHQYAYANIAGDKDLDQFSVDEDRNYLIPMIKDAQQFSKEGFKIIASPWTAPPWMKDNKDWCGGKLLPEYRETWALYYSKYIKAYQKEGINIWAITVENEPLGNGNNWESMHFTAEEMTGFVKEFLGPRLEKDDLTHIIILGYDQNRGEELKHWAKAMFEDEKAAQYFGGTAVHWYGSTFDYFPESLQYTHHLAPGKHLINTEACIDAQIPAWKDDNWYWSKKAKDWGWNWAPENEKYLHPEYVPVFRYAADIIGCLNNYVDGWIDWNMVLDRQGGPNWFKNWCTAPLIADTEKDDLYFTPLYYIMCHFSKFIRPGAVKIGCSINDENILVTSVKNIGDSIVLVIFNPTKQSKAITINLYNTAKNISISAKALQTIIINYK